MTHKEKIAIFDLDGTLWKENSHIEILNSYFNTKFYSSFLYRGISHFFRKQMYKFICEKYKKIPKNYSLNFELPFNQEILQLLNEMQSEGWFILIISNAPYEIAFHASERLNVPFLSAPIGKKKEVLDENYSYNHLFVCTDNPDDIDLIKISEKRRLIWTKYNTDFFYSQGFTKENS